MTRPVKITDVDMHSVHVTATHALDEVRELRARVVILEAAVKVLKEVIRDTRERVGIMERPDSGG